MPDGNGVRLVVGGKRTGKSVGGQEEFGLAMKGTAPRGRKKKKVWGRIGNDVSTIDPDFSDRGGEVGS